VAILKKGGFIIGNIKKPIRNNKIGCVNWLSKRKTYIDDKNISVIKSLLIVFINFVSLISLDFWNPRKKFSLHEFGL
jgi:hypothetical protein